MAASSEKITVGAADEEGEEALAPAIELAAEAGRGEQPRLTGGVAMQKTCGMWWSSVSRRLPLLDRRRRVGRKAMGAGSVSAAVGGRGGGGGASVEDPSVL
mmetsp:Transcript_116482/g.334391  ORF Transcript_116482/g.334391 Transcript_116482/m.334391 type:complete len:101 (+) Transcript_116482:656-958(+)